MMVFTLGELHRLMEEAVLRLIQAVVVFLVSLFIFKRLQTMNLTKETDDPLPEDTEIDQLIADEVDGGTGEGEEAPQIHLIEEQVFIIAEEGVQLTPEFAIIEDTMERELRKCRCTPPLQVQRLGGNNYKISGSRKLIFVRKLNNGVVMVRVGGGWITWKEFLSRHDPCRYRVTNLDVNAPTKTELLNGQKVTVHSQMESKAVL